MNQKKKIHQLECGDHKKKTHTEGIRKIISKRATKKKKTKKKIVPNGREILLFRFIFINSSQPKNKHSSLPELLEYV